MTEKAESIWAHERQYQVPMNGTPKRHAAPPWPRSVVIIMTALVAVAISSATITLLSVRKEMQDNTALSHQQQLTNAAVAQAKDWHNIVPSLEKQIDKLGMSAVTPGTLGTDIGNLGFCVNVVSTGTSISQANATGNPCPDGTWVSVSRRN